MARWDKLGGIGNIEDRRGAGAVLGGGVTVAGVIIALALNYFGINVDPALVDRVINTTQSNQQESGEFAGEDPYEQFVSRVLGSTDEYWQQELQSRGVSYPKPRLVLFREATQSQCGMATLQVGPHYCPPDQTIYLDERFFDVLISELDAQGGETAQAYVIAHEVGHHVQQVNGTMARVMNDPGYRQTGENSLSVRLELQADCYAGLWAYAVNEQGIFEQGDIDQAIDAAEKVGDDYIQSQTGQSVNPETWTHGSSAERKAAFQKGFSSGSYEQCRL